MQAPSALTELDAVNIMLSTIGEAPVSSLAKDQSTVDLAMSRQVLREISLVVLTEGWHFNTEVKLVMTPAMSGEILVPLNCLQVDTTGPSAGIDVALRGARLYDRLNHTYLFSVPVTVDMVVLLAFDEMPQAARHYIAIRAARVFQQRMVGSEALAGLTERDEVRAKAVLKRFDANTGDYNILSGSWSVARTLAR